MSLETLRMFILGFGWLVLLLGSVFILARSIQFYRKVKESPFGKLVLASVAGWLITMYSLGIVSTSYMYRDVAAVRVVFPIFLAWFATFLIIILITFRWSKQAATLQAFYVGLEEEVRQRTQELKQAYERDLKNEKKIQGLQDEFLFIAAHELRSPVSAIRWGLHTILNDEKSTAHLSSEAKQILKTIYKRNEHLKELISRLLDTARLEQGTLTIKQERVDPAQIARETLTEAQHLAVEHHVRLINKVENAALIQADATLLKEILTNLVTNAIRYNVDNGSVTVRERHTASLVTLVVEDTGKGILKEDLRHIFDKFHHIEHGKPSGKNKSVGLGLYITKELVTRMGGAIYAESTEGRGSAFTFTLPRAQ